jgi:predicted secreted protein
MRLFSALLVLLLPASIRGDLSVFQAEAGSLTDAIIKTTHAGYEGTGFADYSDNGGGSIEWTFNAASAGDVDITVRYATRNARPLDLFVDGIKRVRFDCPSSGSWTSWRTETAVVTLDQPGTHVLRLAAPFSGPNVDWLSVLSTDTPKRVDTAAPTESPQNENRPSSITYQAETALSDKVSLQTTHNGYDGSSYADYGGTGAYLMWLIDAPEAASYEVKVKYASANERNCNLYIGGIMQGTLSFGGTGAWDRWDFETMSISLPQGEHYLKIIAENNAGPNIDWISVSTSCSGSSCNVAPAPTPSPVTNTPQPTGTQSDPRANFPFRVVIASNRRIDRGQFVSSRKLAQRRATINDQKC